MTGDRVTGAAGTVCRHGHFPPRSRVATGCWVGNSRLLGVPHQTWPESRAQASRHRRHGRAVVCCMLHRFGFHRGGPPRVACEQLSGLTHGVQQGHRAERQKVEWGREGIGRLLMPKTLGAFARSGPAPTRRLGSRKLSRVLSHGRLGLSARESHLVGKCSSQVRAIVPCRPRVRAAREPHVPLATAFGHLGAWVALGSPDLLRLASLARADAMGSADRSGPASRSCDCQPPARPSRTCCGHRHLKP